RGDLILKVDSDDWLPETGIEIIIEAWESIPFAKRGDFAGVCALCEDPSGVLVGDPFPLDVLDGTNTHVRLNGGIRGDKCEALRTDIVKDKFIPEFNGEENTPTIVLFFQLSQKGLLFRFVNKVA